jgi:hypothetical protein
MKERVSIEKENAIKLDSLSKKYLSKLEKSQQGFSDTIESSVWLEQSSIRAWKAILTENELRAKHMMDYNDQFYIRITDQLKSLHHKLEDWRKKVVQIPKINPAYGILS